MILLSAGALFWTVLVPLSNDIPDPEDVRPGWVSAVLFVLLALAVVLLAFSLRKQLRKADKHFRRSGDGQDPASPDGKPDAPRAP